MLIIQFTDSEYIRTVSAQGERDSSAERSEQRERRSQSIGEETRQGMNFYALLNLDMDCVGFSLFFHWLVLCFCAFLNYRAHLYRR